MSHKTLRVVGSNGFFTVDFSGKILSRHYENGAYDNIDSVVLTETSLPYDFFSLGEVDVCYIGLIVNGEYESPSIFEREGSNGDWEEHRARTIEIPTTRKITIYAESSVSLKYEFDVPLETTDEAIQIMAENVDGGEFDEMPNSGDWSQRWE